MSFSFAVFAKSFWAGGSCLKPRHGRRLVLGQVALRVDRRLAAFGRCERQGHAGVAEHEIGRGTLFEPEAGLASGIAERVVGCQNHQDLHGLLRFFRRLNDVIFVMRGDAVG